MSRPSRSRVLLASVLLFAAACGGDSGGVERAEGRVLANSSTASTLSLASGVTLDVPAGASLVDITVVLTTEPRSRRAAAAGAAVATPLVLTPEGATFEKVVELTIPISATDLPVGATIDDVVVMTAPHGSTTYTPLPTRRVGGAVVAQTTHFSDFVALVPTGAGTDAGTRLPDAGTGGLDAGPLDPDAATGAPDSGAGTLDAGATLPAPNGNLHVFETQSLVMGNLGGPAGADAICMADALRPNSGTYKALVVTASRGVCVDANCASGAMPIDWVLQPNTNYYRVLLASDQLFGTTDASGIITTLLSSTFNRGQNFWIGMNGDWTASATNCADFGSNLPTSSGLVGWDASGGNGFFVGGTFPCDNVASLICVEQ